MGSAIILLQHRISDLRTNMKNYLILFPICSILFGCGSTTRLDDQPITAWNYQSSIDIKKLDKAYYSAKYEGKDSRCAQNDGFKSCYEPFVTISSEETPGKKSAKKYSYTMNDMKAVFKKGEPVEAEIFLAKIGKTGKSGEGLLLIVPGGKPREFLLLALADLSLQRGFKYLVELEGVSAGGCMSNPRADTFGTISSDGTLYSGTTTLSTDSHCYWTESVEVLMLNDREQLAKGIFYTPTYSDKLFIEPLLYVGAARFFPPAFDGVRETGDINIINRVPLKAWEKVYDASGLSRDLRLKYGVTGTKPYTFEDEKESKMKYKDDNVIDKNLVK